MTNLKTALSIMLITVCITTIKPTTAAAENTPAAMPAAKAAPAPIPQNDVSLEGKLRSARNMKISGMVLSLTGISCLGAGIGILVGGSVSSANSEGPTMPMYLFPGIGLSAGSVLFLAPGIPLWVLGKRHQRVLRAATKHHLQPNLYVHNSETGGTMVQFSLGGRF